MSSQSTGCGFGRFARGRQERALLAVLAAVGVAACGGREEEDAASSRQAATYAACSQEALAWASPASTVATCSGSWEYSVPSTSTCYAYSPSIDCTGSGYPSGPACNHAHGVFGTRTVGVRITPKAKAIWSCLQRSITGVCTEPGEIIGYNYDYATPCATAASAEWSKYPSANLNLRSGITYTTSLVPPPCTGCATTCNVTFSNAPLPSPAPGVGGGPGWHFAVDASQCGTSAPAQDLERPTLAQCRGTTTTTCAGTAQDLRILACTTAPNSLDPDKAACGTVKRYSAPGLSLDGLKVADPSAAILLADPRFKPVCLTDENVAAAPGDAAAARAKYERLIARHDGSGAYGVRDQAEHRAAIARKLKLLLEYRGGLLTDAQRAAIVATGYESHPRDLEPCGSWWDPPVESALDASDAFEASTAADVAPGWTTAGQVGGTSIAHGGARAVQLGTAAGAAGVHAVQRSFTVPTTGATLSFWYRPTCAAAGDLFTVKALDLATGAASTLLASCSTSDWVQAVLPLQAFAGHRLQLTLATTDDGVPGAGATTLVDDATWQLVPREAEGLVQMCFRLGAQGVPATTLDAVDTPTARSLAQRCAESIGPVKALAPTYPARAALLAQALAGAPPVLSAAFASVPGADETARRPTLQRHLANVAAWYAAAKDAYVSDPAATAGQKLWLDASDLVGALERGLRQADVDWLRTSLRDDAALRTYLVRSLGRDRELLAALHADWGTEKTPLASAPALLVVADAFRPMLDRLEALAANHDLACRFLECEDTALVTEVSFLYRIVGSLHDVTALGAALAAADAAAVPSSLDWPKWRTVLGQVLARHKDVLEAAAGDSVGKAYDPTFLGDPAPGASTGITELAAVIARARARWTRFDASGLYVTQTADHLPLGLLSSKQAQIRANFDAAVNALANAIASYRGQQQRLVGDLLAEIDTGGNTETAKKRRDELAVRMLQLSEDDLGLKLNGSVEAAAFGDQGREYAALVTALVDENGQRFMLQTATEGNEVSGDGRYRGVAFANVADVAVQKAGVTWKVAAGHAGQLLTLSTQGLWAPTCALQRLGGRFQGVDLGALNPVTGAPESIASAQTGPGGFMLQYSGGQFFAHTTTDASSRSLFGKVEACAGLSWNRTLASWGDPVTSLIGFNVGIEACGGVSWSETHTEQDSRGRDGRSSANFTLGLRLADTPFSFAPAGSLLAVLTPPDNPYGIVDVKVVQEPSTTIAFGEDADVYLVVNDYDCATPGPGSLRVDAALYSSQAAKMTQLGAAMRTAYTELRTKADAVVAQGRLMPDDPARLREYAWQQLRTSCACDLSPYPEAVRGFFGAWIESEIGRIEREINVIAIRRELDQLLLGAAAIDAELDALAQRGRLETMLSAEALRTLDLENSYLGGAVQDLSRVTREQLYPFIRMRYPEAIRGNAQMWGLRDARTTQNADLKALLHFDWENGTLDQLAAAVRNSAVAVEAKWDEAIGYAVGGGVTTTTVVVRFPNAKYKEPTFPNAGKVVGKDRGDALWTDLRANVTTPGKTPITLRIFPEDVYQSGFGGGRLACNQTVPVVKAAALHVDSATLADGLPSPLNSNGYTTDTVLAREMEFALLGERVPFLFDNPDYLTASTRLIYGPDSRVLDTFDAIRAAQPAAYSTSPQGGSPFTLFSFAPFNELADPYLDTASLSVVLELETRVASPGVKGVATCP